MSRRDVVAFMWSDEFKKEILKGGVLGLIVGFLLWQNASISEKMLDAIQGQTRAMVELTETIKTGLGR